MFKIQKDNPKANVQTTIRFDDKLYDEIKALSDQEEVSINSLVLQCCRYALDNLNKNSDEEPK